MPPKGGEPCRNTPVGIASPDSGDGRRTIAPVNRHDWHQVLSRAEEQALPFARATVILHDDQRFLHASQFCGTHTLPREFTPREVITTTVPTWCECRGWEGTRFGQLLIGVAEQYETIDAERTGLRHTRWEDVWHAFVRVHENMRWNYRTNDAELEELRRETHRGSLRILEKSRSGLDHHELLRRIAAQGIRVEVNPEEAIDLAHWARRKLIDTRPDPIGRKDPPMHRFDAILEEVLQGTDRRLVLVRAGGGELPFDYSLPAEVALYLWARGEPTGRTLLLHVPAGVAAGIAVLSERNPRLAVAAEDETDPEVLAAVLALCEDHPMEPLDLDGVLLTSRLL